MSDPPSDSLPRKLSIPLATEEPIRRTWLKTEMQDINSDSKTDPEESSEEDDDTIESSDEDSATGQNKIKNIEAEEEDKDGTESITIITDDNESFQETNMMDYLTREMNQYNRKMNDEADEYEHMVAEADSEGDLLGDVDPELLRTTESNRHIPYEEGAPSILETDAIDKELLVFANSPRIIEKKGSLTVVDVYGAGKSGVLPESHRSERKPKSYLVACDFSKESLYAIEWTMGTMMRDGDTLHVATVVNRDDNPDIVKATGLDEKGELQATSNALRIEAKKLLGKMLLFNIKLVSHAILGRIKDALKSLLKNYSFTMVVCGSRGRGSVRNLLMGSVSTYLVHKSPVPVVVIRRQKKKKKVKHDILHAHSLTESVKSGQLHVDELSK